jgi:acyl-CoA synthetase (AMP-forming)/AMP-acid ligase II/1-acyl-sn-glycerol-3-phosphate acyltransferase/acyl carrier protein
MLNAMLRTLTNGLLRLRYRIRVTGLADVARRGRSGILFLPNHPALIDPIILAATLHARFAPRILADRDQIDRFFIRWAAQRVGVRPMPDVRKRGPAARAEIAEAVRACVADLNAGHNLLLYPSGHLYRIRHEDLRGNSAVETILRQVPDARVVLVRTRGLWGSSFSMATGSMPAVGGLLGRHALRLLASGLFFAPRRDVSIELIEPPDLPRDADRHTLNTYLEDFYNADAPPARYVPYTPWEHGGPRALPEPATGRVTGALEHVPAATRQIVSDYLCNAAGVTTVGDEDDLARDLGLDSLAKAELMLWLAREFGCQELDVDALHTVGDVLLAARGETVIAREIEVKPVPARWFARRSSERVVLPAGDTLTAVFLAQARRGPGRVAIADQRSGIRTYRDVITAVLALRPFIEKLPGDHVGIMLPASVGASIVYLTALFAGKVPVMVNWTTGARNILHTLDLTGTHTIITAGALLTRLEAAGIDLGPVRDRCLLLESLAPQITTAAKLRAAVRARLSWRTLERARVPATAAVLTTSGSESLPKAVPLTHANLLANLRAALDVFTIRHDDVLLGFLPPFHSFGLSVTLVLPLVGGLRAVYHPSPTEARLLARLIETCGATILISTPTFLSGIVRAAGTANLDSLRLAVTGAEKCPPRVYDALARRCPRATIVEGYGITECGPIVSANRAENPQPGTIGPALPTVEWVIVDPDTGAPVGPDQTGLLLVRGPSVFGGYLGDDAASPFVEHAGRLWYRTGDLVSADEHGVFTFRGRLKRFVKLGGEMISLPAIEAVLEPHFATEQDEGPALAVVATPDEHQPEIVLFTTRDADRASVNRLIRAAGLSALHNISRIERRPALPVLGTGKTDYRALVDDLRPPAT